MAFQPRLGKRKSKAREAGDTGIGSSTIRSLRSLPTPPATHQSTLPWGQPPSGFVPPSDSRPPLSDSPAIETPEPTDVSPGPALASDEATILARERARFQIDWSKLGGTYRLRRRNKRTLGENRISWIFKHGAELEKYEQGAGKGDIGSANGATK